MRVHARSRLVWLVAGSASTAACYDGSTGAVADTTGTSAASEATGAASDDTGADVSGGSSGDTGLPPIDPDVCPMLTFENVVDEASCPEVQGRGIEPEFADEIELCRRLHLDLLGVAPTETDFADQCEGREPAEIVDDFMARPEYVRGGQRLWADKLRMTSQVTYYEHIIALDDLVAQLYRGEIDYPSFAIEVATHPGFTGRFDGQDLVGYNFQAFLGRDAAPHERVDLEALFHMWEERFVEQHPVYFFGYSRVVVNTMRCFYTPWACHSDLWGHESVVIDPLVPDNYEYEGPNVLAVEDLAAVDWAELRRPGELLVQQPSFYEAAVDEALLRWLGYKAGVQIPLVRQKLFDILAETNDLRAVDREILTSQLYLMASAYPDPEGTLEEDGSPDFWHGPMKQMTGENWLDSIEKLIAFDLGSCDHRFPNVQGGRPLPDDPYELTVWHPNDYPKDTDPPWPAEANKPDYTYRDAARALGGCPDQESQLRFTTTGVMVSLVSSDIAQAVCGFVSPGAPIVPPGLAPDDTSPVAYEDAVRHVYRAITLRELPADLEAALGETVDGCSADAECNSVELSIHTCASLLTSGDFIFY